MKNSWKCWSFVKIEFLDKKLTFRIVWIFVMKNYLSRWQTKILNEFSAPKNVSWSKISMAVIQLAEWSLAISSNDPSMDLYCKRTMDLVKSPTRMKSPLVFKYNAIMWLKFEHSNLNSLSEVHSQSLNQDFNQSHKIGQNGQKLDKMDQKD